MDQAATYDDLFFYEGEVLLRAQVFRGDCSQVRIAGKTTAPPLQPTEQFLHQLNQELLGVTFVPVRPDTLEIKHAPTSIQSGSGPDFRISRDQDAIQKLYLTASNLPRWPSNKDSNCNLQGTAASYDVLTFSQGGCLAHIYHRVLRLCCHLIQQSRHRGGIREPGDAGILGSGSPGRKRLNQPHHSLLKLWCR